MAWIQDKQEVEVVDLILRLREKLVCYVNWPLHSQHQILSNKSQRIDFDQSEHLKCGFYYEPIECQSRWGEVLCTSKSKTLSYSELNIQDCPIAQG